MSAIWHWLTLAHVLAVLGGISTAAAVVEAIAPEGRIKRAARVVNRDVHAVLDALRGGG